MTTALVTLPDGRKARVTYDTPDQLDAVIADFGNQPPSDKVPMPTVGLGETALQFGTGMVAAPVAGLAGIGAGLGNALGMTNSDAADTVRNVQSALTYQPRTESGRTASRYFGMPFEKLAEGADFVGRNVNDYGAKVLPAPVAAGAGAAANAGIQFLPALLLRGKGKVVDAPEAAAEAYVRSSVPGVDWAALPREIKTQLTEIARTGGDLSALDPVALQRQTLLQSLPERVPATRGQIDRSPVQLRNENVAASTEAGQPIRDIQVAQNEALLRNLEILRDSQGGAARTAEQAGGVVQGALRAQLKAQENKVRSLYQRADAAGETAAQVDVTPILELIRNKPDVTEYGWAQTWMNKMDLKAPKAQEAPPSSPMDAYMLRPAKEMPPPKPPTASIRELERLRQDAGIRTRNGGTEAYYAGQLINLIDQLTEGKGGKLYAEARAARREQAMKFDETRGVGQLVEDKTRTDRRVALEDTWSRTVLNGSLQDLRNVRQQLQSPKGPNVRGKQAWSELRAQTAQYILERATKTSSNWEGGTVTGTRNVSAAGLQQAIRAIGKDKLTEIFGPESAQLLFKVEQATSLLKTDPPPSFRGSPTFPTAVAFLERMSKVPVLGGAIDTTIGTVNAVRNLGKAGETARTVNSAVVDPVQAQAAASRNAFVSRTNRRNALATSAATLPEASKRK